MSAIARRLVDLLRGDPQSDRFVPPSGFTAWLTVFTAAAMGFLAVFALALSVAANRLAEHWGGALAQSATVRISVPEGQMQARLEAALNVLRTTPGVAAVHALERDEMRALLAPWLGGDVALDALPIPQLIDIRESRNGFDAEGLQLRLSAEAPGAVLDDHARWRRPLVRAAMRLRLLAGLSLVVIGASAAAAVALAATAALSASRAVIGVLQLVGARDTQIARAFVRRFSIRALQGGAAGTAVGMIAVALLPSAATNGGFLTGLGFAGAQWLLPLMVPVFMGGVGFWATRFSALRMLRKVPQ